jgi:Ala-tRNA(Pro) deacylase
MYVVDFLRSHRVGFETLLHAPASSATKLAQSMHVAGRFVAKTVLVQAGNAPMLAVLPATSRIDLDRFTVALGLEPGSVRLATSDEIDGIFQDCEPGTIPAFGRLYGIRTVVDKSLAGEGVVVFPTNSRHIGLKMSFRDYAGLEEPLRAAFGSPIAHKPATAANRKHKRRAR